MPQTPHPASTSDFLGTTATAQPATTTRWRAPEDPPPHTHTHVHCACAKENMRGHVSAAPGRPVLVTLLALIALAPAGTLAAFGGGASGCDETKLFAKIAKDLGKDIEKAIMR